MLNGNNNNYSASTLGVNLNSNSKLNQNHHNHNLDAAGTGALPHFRKPTPGTRNKRGSIMNDPTGNNGGNNLVLERYFFDHHSLTVPSSTVRFRGSATTAANSAAANAAASNRNSMNSMATTASGASGTRPPKPHTSLAPAGSYVIENEYQQIILEEKINTSTKARTIQVKNVRSGNKGLQVLRAVYVIVFFLWVGLFVVFCVQVSLDMVLKLPMVLLTDDGNTMTENTMADNVSAFFRLVGVFIALITFVIAFAEGMVIATNMVTDSWNGRRLYKSLLLGRNSLIFLDWFVFIVIVAIPMMSFIIMLFLGQETILELNQEEGKKNMFQWWIVGGITWLLMVTLYFITFTLSILFYELYGATSYVYNHYDDSVIPTNRYSMGADMNINNARTWKEKIIMSLFVIRKCILIDKHDVIQDVNTFLT